MTDSVKKVGGGVSSALTMGAVSTNGNGWAQGGNAKDFLNNVTGGVAGKVIGKNGIPVPDVTAKPGWNLTGADGKLRNDLLLNGSMPKAAGQSQDVLNTMISRANAVGPTEQAKYLQGANNRSMMNSLADADAASAAGQAKTMSTMAMRGGIDAGSRERLAKSFGNENVMNKQRIMNDARGADLNILAQDEANKTNMMSALPSQLLAQAGFEQGGKQFDISNTLSTVGNKYNADMAGWAANQAAREQAQLANKKSGLLGLGIAGIL